MKPGEQFSIRGELYIAWVEQSMALVKERWHGRSAAGKSLDELQILWQVEVDTETKRQLRDYLRQQMDEEPPDELVLHTFNKFVALERRNP